nr:hypothetical protein [Tanacetum cinerariifolium]
DVVKNDDVVKNGDSSKKVIIGSSSDLNFSFGDFVYLHPNDTGGSSVVTIKLTGYVKRNFNSKLVSSNNTSADVHSNNASSSNTSNSYVSLSNEQLARLMNLLNDNGVSTANANMTVNTVKSYFRQTKLPTSLNDFVIEGKVKYGVQKVVNC